MAIVMSQPPPPPARRPPPPRGPPPKGPPPPPPKEGLSGTKRRAGHDNQRVGKIAKSVHNHLPPPPKSCKPPPPKSSLKSMKRKVSIRKPVVLRDVTVFQKKNQVGQGTYG